MNHFNRILYLNSGFQLKIYTIKDTKDYEKKKILENCYLKIQKEKLKYFKKHIPYLFFQKNFISFRNFHGKE